MIARFKKLLQLILRRFPVFGKTSWLIYKLIRYTIDSRKYNFKIYDGIKLESVNRNNSVISFGGYYDKELINNHQIIYHSLNRKIKSTRKNKQLSITINNRKLSETNSWNWQQGAMLNWVDSNRIIYNIYDGNKFASQICNIENNKTESIDFPVYKISNNRQFALSLNFKRLAKLRPDYGYFNMPYHNINKIDETDGIFHVDLLKNKSNLIINLKELFEFETKHSMVGAWHKVNHIDISPNDKRIMFLHRWINKGKKYSRLITSNIDGSNKYILADDELVSHCCWKTDDEIIGFLRKKDIGDHYYLLKDKSMNYEIIGKNILDGDGHPSVSKDKNWLLTDTYPDNGGFSKLLLYNMKSKKLLTLGEFKQPLQYRWENRCDLHPRFSLNSNIISFDSCHTGIRQMYIMDLTKILNG